MIILILNSLFIQILEMKFFLSKIKNGNKIYISVYQTAPKYFSNTLLEIVGFDLILYIIVLNFAIKATFLITIFFKKKKKN